MIAFLATLPFFDKHDLDAAARQAGETIHAFYSPEEALDILPDAEILATFPSRFDREILKHCRSLKWLFCMSAGVEMLPLAELAAMGVTVTNARGIAGLQMAEQTMGMIIAFSRCLSRCFKNQLQKRWEIPPVGELTGKTLCIVGAGSIGREIARKAKAFDMKVIGLKRHVEALENFDEVWSIDRLHEALPQADYTVLITPLTDDTYHLIGAEEFRAMKRSSIFINMSRGDTVDETALIEALKSGSIAGAGLDVFHEEPLPPANPLWEMENVIITPHNAGMSPLYVARINGLFAASLSCYRQGKPLPNRIDLNRKY
jgi:phosphoglycerate dehydrogenase-like enzyme